MPWKKRFVGLAVLVLVGASASWVIGQEDSDDSEDGAPLVMHEFFNIHDSGPGVAPDASRTLPPVERDGVTLPPPSMSSTENGEEPTYTSAGVRDPSAQPLPEQNGPPMRDKRMRLDDDTRKEGQLEYFSVFNPSVIPFKRGGAFDAFEVRGADYEMMVQVGGLTPIPVEDPGIDSNYERFTGSLMIDAAPSQAIPIPSVAPDSRILGYETVPATEVQFFKDPADNFFVIADHQGALRLNFLTDARRTYFGGKLPRRLNRRDIPSHLLPPPLPPQAQESAETVLGFIGISEGDRYDEQLEQLVGYFRDFEAVPLSNRDKRRGGDTYVSIAQSKKGVCRHRSFSFVLTAHALGIPARYVYNEAHAWVEVYIPNSGWMRVDLGGAAEGLNLSNTSSKLRHHSAAPDPFDQPEGFNEDYSRVASAENAAERAGFENIRGLPPSTEEYAESEREALALSGGSGDDPSGTGGADAMLDGSTDGVDPLGVGGGATGDFTTDPSGMAGDPSMAGSMGNPGDPGGFSGSTTTRPTAPQRTATALSFSRAPKRALRGREVVVEGQLSESAALGVDSAPVELWLNPVSGPSSALMLKPIATTTTDSEGRFRVSFLLPQTIALGNYDLEARYAGSKTHQSSSTPRD